MGTDHKRPDRRDGPVEPVQNPDAVGNGPGTVDVVGVQPSVGQQVPAGQQPEPPPVDGPMATRPEPAAERPGDVARHAPVDLQSVRLRKNGPSVVAHDGVPALERAATLPVATLSGAAPAALKGLGNALLAVACEAANYAKQVMEETSSEAGRLAASKVLSDIAIKLYQQAYGSRVATAVMIKSQEDLPAWDELPPHVQEALAELFARQNGG